MLPSAAESPFDINISNSEFLSLEWSILATYHENICIYYSCHMLDLCNIYTIFVWLNGHQSQPGVVRITTYYTI